jgi:glycosyltransferase involved in cell wall biosynthesis
MHGRAAQPHLVHVSQPTEAGVAVCVAELAAAARDCGFRVTVACPAGGDLPGWARDAGARWVELPMARRPGPADLAVLPRLRALAGTADVLHLHSSKAAALGRLAVAGLAAPPLRVVTPHGWSFYVGGAAAPAYRLFERLALRWTDVLTVVSTMEYIQGLSVLGPGHTRLVLVENGVDTFAYRPDGASAARSAAPLLVCVGRLCEQKGQDLLLDALPRMRHRDARLRLIGDGPARRPLAALADRLRVRGRVEFAGRTDPRPHLRAADVVVLPSRWEGMSLALLEAMACGAAVVTTDAGGSDALGAAGIVVPRRELPGGLADAVDGLLDDPRRRRALGDAARARVLRRFDRRQVAAAYRAVWTGDPPPTRTPLTTTVPGSCAG